MAYFQLSLFGKTSQERFHQITGWTLNPCWNHSQIPRFQCLILEDGQNAEWLEGVSLTSVGASWTPSIGENPPSYREESASLSWQILEDSVPQKYYLNPVNCTHFLTLAQRAGYPPPEPVEYLLLKQGGKYPSYVPLRKEECEAVQNREIYPDSYEASDGQMTLFPLFELVRSIFFRSGMRGKKKTELSAI